MRQAIRTTIIGGSNTVMDPGYLGQLKAATRRQGIRLDIVENMAVGGTTCGYGLFRLKTSDALDNSDLLLVEYALNDAFIYGDERRQFRHWARMYEGILRYALARNPRLRICTLVLGARNGSWLDSVPSIDAGIRYLSDWYGASVIDVSRLLMGRFGRDVVTDPAFYSDQGHYSRPIATAIVADLAADALVDAAQCGHWGQAAELELPPAVDPEHFAEATAIDPQHLARILPDARLMEFNNRRFNVSAIDLARHQLTLRLDGGKLLGVFHVSMPQTAALAIGREEEAYHCSLLKAGVRDGRFAFLAGMLPCEFLYGQGLLQATGVETLTLACATTEDNLKRHIAKDNVPVEIGAATPVPGVAGILPLMGLLHSGRCLELSTRLKPVAMAEHPPELHRRVASLA